jgi:hypothetical protein
MATMTAIAYNLLETIGLIRPHIQVMVREISEHPTKPTPLRMEWVKTTDAHGRRILRVQWVEDTSEDRKLVVSRYRCN